MSLGHSATRLTLRVCCALGGLTAAILAYGLLMITLHNKANVLHEMDAELLNQRCALTTLEQSDLKREVIRQDEVTLVIADLAKQGRDLGLNFDSISPGKPQDTTQTGIRTLPIDFTIESEYRSIGRFLACVEECPRDIVEIESLSVHPKQDNPCKLDVQLTLSLYAETEDATQ